MSSRKVDKTMDEKEKKIISNIPNDLPPTL